MTSGGVFAFLIFLAYLMVGTYLIRKSPDKKEDLVNVQVSFGCIYLLVSLVYLFTGLQQVFQETGYPTADRACALFSMYTAFAVTIPASYFCAYIIRGGLRFARRLAIAFTALTCIGIGLTSTTIMRPMQYGWGSTWDFDSILLHAFIIVVCCVPALIAAVLFVQLILKHLESSRARYRIAFITLSFIFIVLGWVILPTASEVVLVVSRTLLLLGALSALLAYHPPAILARRIEQES